MKFLVAIIFLATILFSCGTEGPAGPAGNANVKTVTFTVYADDWDKDYTNSFTGYSKVIPLITQNIVNNGVVLVYYKSTSGTYWYNWDHTSVSASGSLWSWNHSIEFESLVLFVTTTTSDAVPGLIDYNIKVVIIDGTPSSIQKLKSVDYSDYNQVKTKFNLTD
jgi:hypothetical protein